MHRVGNDGNERQLRDSHNGKPNVVSKLCNVHFKLNHAFALFAKRSNIKLLPVDAMYWKNTWKSLKNLAQGYSITSNNQKTGVNVVVLVNTF